MASHPGGCLCGAVRYETVSDPLHVTICHCRFCQRATGAAYMVEPVFRLGDLRIVSGAAATYRHRSEDSCKMVSIHFCAACGTKVLSELRELPRIAPLEGIEDVLAEFPRHLGLGITRCPGEAFGRCRCQSAGVSHIAI